MPNRSYTKATAHCPFPIHIFQNMLATMDDVQTAVVVGQLDDAVPDVLNWLSDLQRTIEETMQELEQRAAW